MVVLESKKEQGLSTSTDRSITSMWAYFVNRIKKKNRLVRHKELGLYCKERFKHIL